LVLHRKRCGGGRIRSCCSMRSRKRIRTFESPPTNNSRIAFGLATISTENRGEDHPVARSGPTIGFAPRRYRSMETLGGLVTVEVGVLAQPRFEKKNNRRHQSQAVSLPLRRSPRRRAMPPARWRSCRVFLEGPPSVRNISSLTAGCPLARVLGPTS
jgi:hypothetical protein